MNARHRGGDERGRAVSQGLRKADHERDQLGRRDFATLGGTARHTRQVEVGGVGQTTAR